MGRQDEQDDLDQLNALMTRLGTSRICLAMAEILDRGADEMKEKGPEAEDAHMVDDLRKDAAVLREAADRLID